MRVKNVSYMLYVQDMPRARRFWEGAFGAETREAGEHFSTLALQGASVDLHLGQDTAQRETGLSLEVDDIQAAAQAVQAAGGTIDMAPERRPGEPIMLGKCYDPEGNLFRIVQHVG